MHAIFGDVYLVHHLALTAAAADRFEVVHALLCAVPAYQRFVQREALEQLQAACIRERRESEIFLGSIVVWELAGGRTKHSVFDRPAVQSVDGDKLWYRLGKLHRDNDHPAVEYADGAKEWYQHNKRHRDNDLPAVEYASGTKEWWQRGKLHRDNDRPAIERADGTTAYYRNGEYAPPWCRPDP